MTKTVDLDVAAATLGDLIAGLKPNEEVVTWTDEWFRFSGDERALNGSSLKTAPVFEPSTWEQFSQLADRLASHVRHRLRGWYQQL